MTGEYKTCGDDFQAWLDENIPYPTEAGVPAEVTADWVVGQISKDPGSICLSPMWVFNKSQDLAVFSAQLSFALPGGEETRWTFSDQKNGKAIPDPSTTTDDRQGFLVDLTGNLLLDPIPPGDARGDMYSFCARADSAVQDDPGTVLNRSMKVSGLGYPEDKPEPEPVKPSVSLNWSIGSQWENGFCMEPAQLTNETKKQIRSRILLSWAMPESVEVTSSANPVKSSTMRHPDSAWVFAGGFTEIEPGETVTSFSFCADTGSLSGADLAQQVVDSAHSVDMKFDPDRRN